MRLTNFGVSLDFDLGQLIRGDKKKQAAGLPAQAPAQSPAGIGQREGRGGLQAQEQESALRDEYGYSVFDVPWSMRVSYNFNYSKPGFKSTVSQTLSLNGTVTLTKKMAITYTSGYDFTGKEITMTQISELHATCIAGI